MNKKIIILILVVSFFTILNFSKLALAEDCVVTIDTTHSLTVTCGNADYNVSFLACGYIGNDNAGTFTVSIGGVSGTFQLLVNQSRTLSNGASFKLNSVLCSANQTQNPSATVYSITPPLSPSVTCTDSDGGINYSTKGNTTSCSLTSQGGGCGTAVDSCSGSVLTEGYCDGSQIKSITYTCPNGCSDGACLASTNSTPPSCVSSASLNGNSCTDSDGSMNYYNNGIVHVLFATGFSHYDLDVCNPSGTNPNQLREWCCLTDGTLTFQDFNCTYGCKNSACLTSNATNVTDIVPVCNDTDGGINYTVAGAAIGVWSQTNRITALNDYCSSNKILQESYCANNYAQWLSTYTCPGMCLNGACVNTTSSTNSTCTDSDGGENYFVKGTITGLIHGGGMTTMVDSCWPHNFYNDSYDYVLEYYCLKDNTDGKMYIQNNNVKCLYGCVDGACLNSPVSTSNNSYTVTVQASDSSDSYVRDWNIFTYDPTGTYIGSGAWSSGKPLKTSYYTRSGTWSFNLDSGTYYLVIGQTGGVSYGTYSGQISVNGVNMQFTNADINHAIKFNVPLQVTTKQTCVNHDECSQACDNLGISSHWIGSGSYRRTWEGTCPSGVYGCMTGDCCLGQCPSSGDCLCQRTNVVDIYGSVCPTGSTCGQDCSCHPTGGTGKGYEFSVKTDKYSYSSGDEMKITATLSGNSSMDFSGATVTTTVGGTNIIMNSIGTGTSACTSSATGTTCSISTTYYFVGKYEVPSGMTSGVYNVLSTAILNGDREDATANFQVGSGYKDYVDVSISPHEQNTIVGNEVDYYVTVIDKHPAMACPAIVGSNCTSQSYDYIIDVEGLPYHTVVPSDVNVYAGGLKTFELRVFPSSVKTSEGITATIQTTNATTERSVGITGKVVATQASSETVPVQEAVFKFAVKAYLKDDVTVSHSDAGILHVRFVQTPQPTPFQNTEKMSVELRKGWNLISLPGKGSGFTQGSCSADQKPIAFVYLPDKQRFANMEEAISAMGNGELLNHLSTHSFWVYSYEDCSIGFNVGGYSTYSGLVVDSGWNLLGITKDMVGETLSNIKGNCVFEKIYNWDSSSQKWMQMSENDLIDKMGYGIAVKASAACVFKANFIQPPTFPGG